MDKTGTKAPHGSVPVEEASDIERSIRDRGPEFINSWFSAAKTLMVHELDNRASQHSLSDLSERLQTLLQIVETVEIRVTIDLLAINGVRLNTDNQTTGPVMYVAEQMKKRDVECIEIDKDTEQASLGRFLRLFFAEAPVDDPYEHYCERMKEESIDGIRIVQWVERERRLSDADLDITQVREESNRAYFRTVALMGEVLKGIEERKAIQFKKAERLTQRMVDLLQVDESILVGLASIKNFDEYTFAHSVNVCILSMLIADRLRLYKSDIARLGVAALLHDIGKTYIPQTILNKPGRLEANDWELMKYHTIFGVKELSRLNSLRDITDVLFVTLQHHVQFNMDGYPQKPGGWDLRLFTRIVTIADYYDAMTTPRIYNKDPVTPEKALGFIMKKSGQTFDPFLAKVFIKAMGMYPVGTVVELDTGELGLVVRQNDNHRFFHRPVVTMVDDTDETAVDLSQVRNGRYLRSVIRSVFDPEVERDKGSRFLHEAVLQ